MLGWLGSGWNTPRNTLMAACLSASVGGERFQIELNEFGCILYSGTSLIHTPMGQKKMSMSVRCPYFRC